MHHHQLVCAVLLSLCAALLSEQAVLPRADVGRHMLQDAAVGNNFGPALAMQVSGAPSPSSSPASEEEALRIFQQGSRNFRDLQAQGLSGWADSTGAASNPCVGWTGVTCDRDGHVIALELTNWDLETRLPPELSLLTKLQYLNLTGNNLSGGLPSNWGLSSIFPQLQILDLSHNPNLSGALPPNWGTQGAFPGLRVLSLAYTGVSGQLPAAWGAQDSLPELVQLDLSNNVLAGVLPASWGTVGAFANLENLELCNNSLSGTLPTQWGSSRNGPVLQSLLKLDLSSNTLTGTLPSAWGTGFEELSELHLQNNSLSGTLPSDWADQGHFSNLTLLDMHENELSGSLPTAWDDWAILSELKLILMPGNTLCGTPSAGLQQALSSGGGESVKPCTRGAPAPSPKGVEALVPSPSPAGLQPPAASLVSQAPSPGRHLPPAKSPISQPTTAPHPAPSKRAPAPFHPPLAVPAMSKPPNAHPQPSRSPAPAPGPTSATLAPALSPRRHPPARGVPAPGVPAPAARSTEPRAPAYTVAPLPSYPTLHPPPLIAKAPAPAPNMGSTLATSPELAPTVLPVPAPAPDLSVIAASNAPAPLQQPPQEAPAPEPALSPLPQLPGLTVPVPSPVESAPAPEPVSVPVIAAISPDVMPSESPEAVQAPAPGPDSPAQVSARYILNGPNLDQNNDTVRQILVSAMNETLQLGRDVPITLQSFRTLQSQRRRVLAEDTTAQAIFAFNTTSAAAPVLVNQLNSTSTTTRYVQQLGQQGLPNVEPTLNETSINSPLITNPLTPSAAPGPEIVPISRGDSSISGGAIAGIVVGAAVAVVFAAALFHLCCRRSRRQGKSDREEDTEKGEDEEAKGAREQGKPGFLSRLKGGNAIAVKADASPERHGQRKPATVIEEEDQPEKRSRTAGLLSSLTPAAWAGQPKIVTQQSRPQNEVHSPMGDNAAKAAQKYKSGNGDSLGARFARPSPAAGGGRRGRAGRADDLDSFEELEGHQIQTIPEALLEKRDHIDELHLTMEALEDVESKRHVDMPSQASTPSSWPVSEITEIGSEETLLPNQMRSIDDGNDEAFFDPAFSFGSPMRKQRTNSKQHMDSTPGSSFWLRSGEQYPSSYSRRGMDDQSQRHKSQRLAANRSLSPKGSFDGHEKISKGGFVKRAVQDDRPPPSSFSRRQVDDPRLAKQIEDSRRSAPAARQGSGSLIRKTSGNTPSSMHHMPSGELRQGSGDLKAPGRQSKGILRHSSNETRLEAGLQRVASKGDVPGSARSGGMSRSGSLQRVVSFEDEKVPREELPSRAASLRSGSSGDSRMLSPRNDLATVREVPSSSSRRYANEELKSIVGVSHHKQQPPGSRPLPARGFVRQANQEPRFRTHTEPALVKPDDEEHSLQGWVSQPTEHQAGGRQRGARPEGRRSANPTPRGGLDESQDKWEKEAARLKALEQHMRNAITPRNREKPEPSARRPADAARQGQVRSGSKPSLEEMLVLIEDARKLYSPGSDTRQKLDLKAQEFSARLEVERQRQRALRRAEPEL